MKNKFYNEKIEVLTIRGWVELVSSLNPQLRYGEISKAREIIFKDYEDMRRFFAQGGAGEYHILPFKEGPYKLFERGYEELGFQVIRNDLLRTGINIYAEQLEFRVRFVKEENESLITFEDCRQLPKEEFIQYIKDCEIK